MSKTEESGFRISSKEYFTFVKRQDGSHVTVEYEFFCCWAAEEGGVEDTTTE